jgi:CheY-like chemotaxis protein
MADQARILVVDDSPSKRYVITSWLRREGYDVVEAQTGGEALARMAADIDLAVVDVRLPDMSGFAVCEQIKNSGDHGSTPVIHISAAAVDTVARSEGLARGADAYLVEPIDPDEMLATVTAILRYYRGRRDAERLAARLSTLTRLTLRLSRARNLSWLLSEAAAGATRIYHTPVMVSAIDADGTWLVAVSSGPGQPVTVRHWTPPDRFPATGSYADLDPAVLKAGLGWSVTDTVRVVAVSARADRSPTYLAVPTGVSDPGSPVLTLLGQAVAAATDALRAYSVEHQLALTLQRSLLPRRLPRIDGLDLAVRYVPASETAEIGGDFYELSYIDGRLLVAVGDVGGHSLHAATVMAELRHATRAYVAEGHSPAEVIGQLDGLMRRLMPEEIATICVLTLDPVTGEMQLANAGHPAPIIIDNGTVAHVTEHGPLLGLRSSPPANVRLRLPEGATMVLYTDGLVERRGEVIDEGIARLSAVAATANGDIEALCDRIVEIAGPREPTDDIAVVALRRHRG